MTKEEIRNVDAFALMQAIAMAQGEKMKEEEKELDIPYGTESIKEFIEERKMAKKEEERKREREMMEKGLYITVAEP